MAETAFLVISGIAGVTMAGVLAYVLVGFFKVAK
jgi:hypothetical protein